MNIKEKLPEFNLHIVEEKQINNNNEMIEVNNINNEIEFMNNNSIINKSKVDKISNIHNSTIQNETGNASLGFGGENIAVEDHDIDINNIEASNSLIKTKKNEKTCLNLSLSLNK